MKSQDSRNKNQDFERFVLMKSQEPRIKILKNRIFGEATKWRNQQHRVKPDDNENGTIERSAEGAKSFQTDCFVPRNDDEPSKDKRKELLAPIAMEIPQ